MLRGVAACSAPGHRIPRVPEMEQRVPPDRAQAPTSARAATMPLLFSSWEQRTRSAAEAGRRVRKVELLLHEALAEVIKYPRGGGGSVTDRVGKKRGGKANLPVLHWAWSRRTRAIAAGSRRPLSGGAIRSDLAIRSSASSLPPQFWPISRSRRVQVSVRVRSTSPRDCPDSL